MAMASGFVRLRERRQLTLPQKIVNQIGLKQGDILEFVTTRKGTIELRPARIVTMGTPEAKQEEEAAKEDIRQGKYSVITNLDEFQQHVDRVRKGDHPATSQTANPEAPGGHGEALIEVEPFRNEEGASGHLTWRQRQEVEAIVEDILKRFQSGASGSRSILREHAQNRVEQR
jgi:AbrB family looped-hinge helix DNA binding protein